MPPRRSRHRLDDGSAEHSAADPSQAQTEETDDAQEQDDKPPYPTWVFHVVERPYFHPLGLKKFDRVVATGGWPKERTGGHRLEFHAHVWSLAVGKQYLRCWWPTGAQWIHLDPGQARKV